MSSISGRLSRPRVVDGEDVLQVWRALNKLRGQPTKGGHSALGVGGVGRGANNYSP
jgi:hypothetical protein